MTPPPGEDDLACYPSWLERQEREQIEARRRAVGVDENDRVGLALSGGGIRSATFALGVLQALARRGLLRHFDFMSTVSGGGYVGGFLGSLYSRSRSANATREVEEVLTKYPESAQLKWLRGNGRYLSPTGPGGSWLAAATLLRNWCAIVFVLLVGAFALSLLGELLHFGLLEIRRLVPRLPPIEARVIGGVWLSPIFSLPLSTAVILALSSGIAFWFVPLEGASGEKRAGLVGFMLLLAVVSAFAFAVPWVRPEWTQASPMTPFLVGVVGGSTVAQWVTVTGWRVDDAGELRHKLSHRLKGALAATLVLALVALGDSFGQTLYAYWLKTKSLSAIGAAFGGVAASVVTAVLSAHQVLAKLASSREQKGEPSRLPAWLPNLAALVVALLLATLGCAVVSFGAHLLICRGLPAEVAAAFGAEDLANEDFPPSLFDLAYVSGAALLVAWVISRFYAFVNQSSLSSFYAARLTRAYLGASNPRRTRVRKKRSRDTRGERWRSRTMSRTEPIRGDQIPMCEYLPHEHGGPLHLINVTLNETIDPRAQIHQADRQGLPLALGPQSISVATRHHARWEATRAEFTIQSLPKSDDARFRIFGFERSSPAENLSLGNWIAISGAAVATGMGSRTAFGVSLLLGMFNMRLGHWWDAGIEPDSRPNRARALGPGSSIERILSNWFPVYAFLAYELFARFPGTAHDSWYLSDGGHFENTGCYELIRRRLPFIVCVDAGADPDYELADAANLVRLARIDFGAEIEFLDETALDDFVSPSVRGFIGTLEQLRSSGWREAEARCGGPHAALARVRYANDGSGERGGILLLLKPTICGDEPQDVRYYRAEHPDFPQESTADQYFDEAQWEAYRRLGEHVGACVFGNESVLADDKWDPACMSARELYARLERGAPPSAQRALVSVRKVTPQGEPVNRSSQTAPPGSHESS
jgi:hypothetical protein